VAAPLTESAIRQMHQMIASGRLLPGARLPSEAELATELGLSRTTVREAVRALVTARVLDVRRGDGTFVTSLRPELLLDGIGAAAELMQEGAYQLELVQVRRILEPEATAMAALRLDRERMLELEVCLLRMTEAASDEELVRFDEEFHTIIARASGNETLASMLKGVSSRSLRMRAWRGVIEDGARARTVSQHGDILRALRQGDPALAHAMALVHVSTTEEWLRSVVGHDDERPEPTGHHR
jgi:GntR family transcriptional repressor for pyruvate dehydrogenase complex